MYRNSGNAAYIGELFQRYTHLVFGVCMKYFKNVDESKDGVMDVFEKILTELKRHEVENFKPWLYFVAKNHCLMKLRKETALHVKVSTRQPPPLSPLPKNAEIPYLGTEELLTLN